MEKWIGHFHIQVNARTEDDVVKEAIIKQMTKALGAAYESGQVNIRIYFALSLFIRHSLDLSLSLSVSPSLSLSLSLSLYIYIYVRVLNHMNDF
mgnify:CR=1 FL=1